MEEHAAATPTFDTTAFDKALAKQTRNAIMAGVAVSMAFLPLLAVQFIFRDRNSGLSTWVLACFVFVVVITFVRTVRTFKRLGRAGDLVPAHDGKVCPECVEQLQPADAAKPACVKCGGSYDAHDVRRYWDMFATDTQAGMKMRAQLRRKSGRPRTWSWQNFGDNLRDSWRWRLGYFFAIIVAVSVVTAAITDSSVLYAFLQFAPMIVFMTGVIMLASGIRRREEEGSFCAACHYQRPPSESGPARERCPECGAAWNAVGGTRHGETKREPRLIIAGAFIILIGLAIMMNRSLFEGVTTNVLPTRSLIHLVTRTNAGFTNSEWDELNARTLTEEESIELATGLLDRRRVTFLMDQGHAWLQSKVQISALPRELVTRYFEEDLDITLIGPSTAKVGEPIRIATAAIYRAGTRLKTSPQVLVSGYFVDDDPEPVGRREEAIHGIMFGTERVFPTGDPTDPGDSPVLELTPTKPGTIRVRFEVWIVHVTTPRTTLTVPWNDDGTPAMPFTPDWMHRRTLEHVIEVSE